MKRYKNTQSIMFNQHNQLLTPFYWIETVEKAEIVTKKLGTLVSSTPFKDTLLHKPFDRVFEDPNIRIEIIYYELDFFASNEKIGISKPYDMIITAKSLPKKKFFFFNSKEIDEELVLQFSWDQFSFYREGQWEEHINELYKKLLNKGT